MMTKLTMPGTPAVNQSFKSGRQAAAKTGATASREADFAKIVDKNLDNQATVSKSYSSENSGESGVQAKYAYDDVDPARMDQLRQGAKDSLKDEPPGDSRPESEDFLTTEELEQISLLAASMRKLAENDDTLDEQSKLEAVSGVFNDILDEVNKGAQGLSDLNSSNKVQPGLSNKNIPDDLLKKLSEKLTSLLEALQKTIQPEDATQQDMLKIAELLTKLLSELNSAGDQANGEGKLDSASETGKQLLMLLNSLKGKDAAATESDSERSLQAILQLVINRTSQMIGQGETEEKNTLNKKEFAVKLKETIHTVLAAAAQKDGDKEGLKSTIETLVAELFATDVNDKNKSTINGILQKYGLISAEGGKSANKLELDELKSRIANALMLMAEKVNDGTEKKGDSGIGLYDKFSDALKDSLQGKDILSQDVKGKKDTTADEDKLLNRLLGKESSETDSKTTKINTLITHLNNSKNEITAEKVVEKPVITKGNFDQDIIKTVRYMSLNNLKELTVKIAPKELGEITIVLTTSGETMKASITANTKDAFGLLSSNVGEIKSALDSSSIRIQDVEINISQEDTTFNRNNANADANRQDSNPSSRNRNQNSNRNENIIEGIDNIAEDDRNISILI